VRPPGKRSIVNNHTRMTELHLHFELLWSHAVTVADDSQHATQAPHCRPPGSCAHLSLQVRQGPAGSCPVPIITDSFALCHFRGAPCARRVDEAMRSQRLRDSTRLENQRRAKNGTNIRLVSVSLLARKGWTGAMRAQRPCNSTRM
jgi:hypothetical protein